MVDDTTTLEPQPTVVPEPHSDVTNWKEEAKKWEARAKADHKRVADLKAKADKWDAYEKENLTELERLTDERNRLKDELDARRRADEQRLWADEIQAVTGVPAQVLRGSTKEEMQAHAQQFLDAGISAYGHVPDKGEPIDAPITADEILAIKDSAKRRAAIKEHADLF